MNQIDKVENKVKNRTIHMDLTYKCKECGKEESISLKEIFKIDDMGLCVSGRCKECRAKKKVSFDERNGEVNA